MSEEIKNPPAFPDEVSDGMTLLDYFAAKALVGIIENDNYYKKLTIDDKVSLSYMFAQVMLKERAKYIK